MSQPYQPQNIAAPPESQGPGRARRALGLAAKSVGLVTVFTGALVAGLGLHIGMAAPRRFVTERVNAILDGTFAGTIHVERIGKLNLLHGSVDGVDAEVLDPDGQRAIRVQGVSARIAVMTLVRSLVGSGGMKIALPHLHIDSAEVVVGKDAAGHLNLQRAFADPDPNPDAKPSKTEVSIPKVELGHAWAHGALAGVPAVIDADLDEVNVAVIVNGHGTTIVVPEIKLQGRGMPGRDPSGELHADLDLPSDPKEPMKVGAWFDGQVGAVPVHLNGGMAGDRVDASVDVPETDAAAFAGLAPGQVSFGAPVSAHVEAHGSLPVLYPVAEVHVGKGSALVSGMVRIPDDAHPLLVATAHAEARDVDPSVWHEGAPAKNVNATLDAQVLGMMNDDPTATFTVTTTPGDFGGQVIPAVAIRGHLEHKKIHATADIDEVGAPTRVDVWTTMDHPTRLSVHARTAVADLGHVPRLALGGRGAVTLDARGLVDIEHSGLEIEASGNVENLVMSGVRLASADLSARAHGLLTAPRIVALIQGSGLHAGGYGFRHVALSASGTPSALDIGANLAGDRRSPSVLAKADLTTTGDLTVKGVRVDLKRDDVTSVVRVAEVRVAKSGVEIEGATIDGLGGHIAASAHIGKDRTSGKAKGHDVDLARVATLLGSDEEATGKVAFDVDASMAGRDVKAHVHASAKNVRARGIDGGELSVHASIDGRHVDGKVVVAAGDAGKIELSGRRIELGGAPTNVSSWKTASGAVAFQGDIDLRKVMEQIPVEQRPFDAAEGQIVLTGNIVRERGREVPTIALSGSTDGLALAAHRSKTKNADGTITLGEETWHTAGLDGAFDVKVDGTNGRTDVSFKFDDARGPLASFTARADLPWATVMRNPEKLMELGTSTPVEAKIVIPHRSLDDLPAALGASPVKGEVELAVDVSGTAKAPKVHVAMKGQKMQPREATRKQKPFDVDVVADYDGKKADVTIDASREGKKVIAAKANADMLVASLLKGSADWQASAEADLTDFPLDVVASIIGERVAGTLTGKVKLDDLHKAGHLVADLDAKDLALDRASFPTGKVHFEAKDGTLDGSVKLNQTDGNAEATVKGAVSWGSAVAPALDDSKPMDLTLKTKGFRADALVPVVRGAVSELDGRIDADAKLHLVKGGKDNKLEGTVALHDGVFEVPQIGEKFRSVELALAMKPGGKVEIQKLTALAPSGQLSGKGEAALDGFALKTAKATISIAKGQSIPITLEGVSVGRAYGDVTADAKMASDGKKLELNVNVPILHVDLPNTSGHSVQALEPDKTVRIGYHDGDDLVTVPLVKPDKPREASELAIVTNVKIGSDVEIKRDTTVDVVLHGTTKVEVTDKTRVTGRIILERGTLEVQGKKFVVDRGTVTFTGGEPSNPMVVATAHWDGPEGTRVYADFSGYVSSGKLTLRSEPALSQDEILALVLFGSTEGSLGATSGPPQSTGVKAAGMAGGVLTDSFNKAISGVTAVNISARVDSSQQDGPRPEVDVQIGKNVTAKIGYQLGSPAPGENPDRAMLTLDWRFARAWSLDASVGDAGSSALDLVWRFRY